LLARLVAISRTGGSDLTQAVTTAARSSNPTSARGRARRADDRLILLSACVAVLITLVTAYRQVPLSVSPLQALLIGLDAILAFYLTATLTVLQRRRALGAFLALLIANGLLAASALKMAVLGQPGFFGDVLLLPDLLRVLEPGQALTAVVVCLALLGLYLANLAAPRTASEAALLAPLALAALSMASLTVSPWLASSAAQGIPVPGFYGHFYTAYSTFVRNADWTHTVRRLQATAGATLPHPPLAEAVLPPWAPRNVHIVVAESFTDPAWYPGYGLADAPVPPLFARWRQGPSSTALSPVFGGRSSNAEFEVLCGVPAAAGPSEIVFWRLGSRALPCLPRLLGERGYDSLSLVPSSPAIFNAGVAYRSVGFARTVFADQLDTSDRDGRFLSAEATLRQHFDRIEPLLRTGRPVLSYAFVNAGHYPYERNEARRPTALRTTPSDALVEAYVNGTYYSALAIDRFVERLQVRDPQSLIVVLGDHAPPLGPDFEGYRRGGRIAPDDPEPLKQAAVYEVPLLVIDAGKPVPLGRLPSYLIPYVVLDGLTQGEFCRRNGCAWKAPWRLRPFRDFVLLVEAHGTGTRLCASFDTSSQPCRGPVTAALAWQLQLLDLLDGTRPGSPRYRAARSVGQPS
jgi:Sulfatase